MRGRPKGKQRALGPYRHRNGYRIVEVAADGTRCRRFFATKGEAIIYRDEYNAAAATIGITIAGALEQYERHYLVTKGNKLNSWIETKRRILALLGEDQELEAISPRRATELYAKYAASGLAVNSHRGALVDVKTFLGWCSIKGYCAVNPFADVKGVGKKRQGKDQLRRDEAREWLRVAYAMACSGDERALLAMLTLLLGMRASEILQRQVRDVDDAGTVLVIPSSKTAAGRRILQIPAPLQHLLRALVKDRKGDELLFGQHTRQYVNTWVQKICILAGVRVVTAHGMRGLHASLAVEEGTTPHVVTRAMGHESFTVTAAHYATAQAIATAHHKRVAGTFQLPAPKEKK